MGTIFETSIQRELSIYLEGETCFHPRNRKRVSSPHQQQMDKSIQFFTIPAYSWGYCPINWGESGIIGGKPKKISDWGMMI